MNPTETNPLNPSPQANAPAAALPAEETAPAAEQKQDPLSYEKLSLPEDVSWAPDALEKFTALGKELGITPEQAQKLVDLETAFVRNNRTAQEQAARAQSEAWAAQIRAQYGANYQAEIDRAVAAADAFGGPELRALLEETGLGNHPVIVRTFNEIGKRISEDCTPHGQVSAAERDKTFAEALYGKH